MARADSETVPDATEFRSPREKLLIGIGLVDFFFWLAVLMAPPGLPLCIAFLLVRCTILVMIGVALRDTPSLRIPCILMQIMFVAFSVFGVLAVCMVLKQWRQRPPGNRRLYHIDNEEGEQVEPGDHSTEGIAIDEMRRVAPLIDGMTAENKNSRIAAIQAMEKVAGSGAIREMLRDAKKDPHKEVQYYANDALNKINDGYLEQIKDRLDSFNALENPQSEDYLQLADLYSSVADAGIDHPVLLQFYAQEAIKYYTYVLENFAPPGSDAVDDMTLRETTLRHLLPTLYNNRDFDKCLQFCELATGIESLRKMSLEYTARCLFRLKRMATLQEFARRHANSGIDSINAYRAMDGIS